jgi:hypothetical protein
MCTCGLLSLRAVVLVLWISWWSTLQQVLCDCAGSAGEAAAWLAAGVTGFTCVQTLGPTAAASVAEAGLC